jgi:phosphatidylglycerophosphate synthase
VADLLSLVRIALAVAVATLGAGGMAHGALLVLAAAAMTDVLDGPVARRRGPSRLGERLDGFADVTLLGATAMALAVLHPKIVDEPWLAPAMGLYVVSTGASWLTSRRLVDPRQPTSKAAGGLLYLFAVVTLLTGAYVPLLLALATAVLAASSLQTILAAIRTVQATARPRSVRSHAPQAVNGVASRASPAASVASSATPSATDIRP